MYALSKVSLQQHKGECMKKLGFITVLLCMSASPAFAGGFFTSIEQRADHMNAQLEGKNDYHAYLAKELADIAMEEKSQHDISVARYFMSMAEDHASQSGGK